MSGAHRKAGDMRGDAPRERSVGEHIFIWVAWAFAAAFWGATMTAFIGILRAAGPATGGISAPAASGVSGYLLLVIVAFLGMAGALAYGSLRSAHGRDLRAMSDAGAAALYDAVERQGGEDMTRQSPDLSRSKRDFP